MRNMEPNWRIEMKVQEVIKSIKSLTDRLPNGMYNVYVLSAYDAKFIGDMSKKRVFTEKQQAYIKIVAAKVNIAVEIVDCKTKAAVQPQMSFKQRLEEADMPFKRADGSWEDLETGFTI